MLPRSLCIVCIQSCGSRWDRSSCCLPVAVPEVDFLGKSGRAALLCLNLSRLEVDAHFVFDAKKIQVEDRLHHASKVRTTCVNRETRTNKKNLQPRDIGLFIPSLAAQAFACLCALIPRQYIFNNFKNLLIHCFSANYPIFTICKVKWTIRLPIFSSRITSFRTSIRMNCKHVNHLLSCFFNDLSIFEEQVIVDNRNLLPRILATLAVRKSILCGAAFNWTIFFFNNLICDSRFLSALQIN